MVRVCEGGRSAYVQKKDRSGRVNTFLRNRRFMIVDPKYKVEVEAESDWAMATGEGEIAGDSCLPIKRLSRKARAALRRTKASVSGILKGTLALLPRAPPPGPTARGPRRRKVVTWGSVVTQ